METITQPPPPLPEYSSLTGLVYVFNVIVGTGALTIPAAVASTGYALSTVFIILLALFSFMTVTFMIECMAIANALQNSGQDGLNSSGETEIESSDEAPLITGTINRSVRNSGQLSPDLFSITKPIEMSTMSTLFLPPLLTPIFYLTIIIYLFGDLSIYISAISLSIRDVVCDAGTSSTNSTDLELCFPKLSSSLDRIGAYRLFTIIFIVIVGPFACFNVNKTKYLQIFTNVARCSAFTLMIVLSVHTLIATPNPNFPPSVNVRSLPLLLGTSIYSFMCHHSLPSIVTPIKNKKNLTTLFLLDYILIASFYLVLALTGTFAFYPALDPLFTLNFKSYPLLSPILSLFPVFTLSTNFPIISITLRNNLRTLLGIESTSVLTIFSIIPPFLLSLWTSNVQLLLNITGAYAGALIQYVFPILFVYYGRKKILDNRMNPHQSPFRHSFYLILLLSWTVVSIIIVSLHLVI